MWVQWDSLGLACGIQGLKKMDLLVLKFSKEVTKDVCFTLLLLLYLLSWTERYNRVACLNEMHRGQIVLLYKMN